MKVVTIKRKFIYPDIDDSILLNTIICNDGKPVGECIAYDPKREILSYRLLEGKESKKFLKKVSKINESL